MSRSKLHRLLAEGTMLAATVFVTGFVVQNPGVAAEEIILLVFLGIAIALGHLHIERTVE